MESVNSEAVSSETEACATGVEGDLRAEEQGLGNGWAIPHIGGEGFKVGMEALGAWVDGP